MKMSHLIADTTKELIDMVRLIGVNEKWIQHPGEANEHFDICFSKRKLAVKNGAKEINFREYATFVGKRKKKHVSRS